MEGLEACEERGGGFGRKRRTHLRAKIFVESRQINNSWTRHFRGTKTHLSLVQTQFGFSILLSSSARSKSDLPFLVGQPPLSTIDLHLELFLREPAYLSHSFRSCFSLPTFGRLRHSTFRFILTSGFCTIPSPVTTVLYCFHSSIYDSRSLLNYAMIHVGFHF